MTDVTLTQPASLGFLKRSRRSKWPSRYTACRNTHGTCEHNNTKVSRTIHKRLRQSCLEQTHAHVQQSALQRASRGYLGWRPEEGIFHIAYTLSVWFAALLCPAANMQDTCTRVQHCETCTLDRVQEMCKLGAHSPASRTAKCRCRELHWQKNETPGEHCLKELRQYSYIQEAQHQR